jgi:hypothetical protein
MAEPVVAPWGSIVTRLILDVSVLRSSTTIVATRFLIGVSVTKFWTTWQSPQAPPNRSAIPSPNHRTRRAFYGLIVNELRVNWGVVLCWVRCDHCHAFTVL